LEDILFVERDVRAFKEFAMWRLREGTRLKIDVISINAMWGVRATRKQKGQLNIKGSEEHPV
jgi:hypothetical protein